MTGFRNDDPARDGDRYDRIDTFGHDLGSHLNPARAADGPVLDICTGAGRLTLPLAQHRF